MSHRCSSGSFPLKDVVQNRQLSSEPDLLILMIAYYFGEFGEFCSTLSIRFDTDDLSMNRLSATIL